MEVRRGCLVLVPLAAVLVMSSFLCRDEAAVMRDDLKVGCYSCSADAAGRDDGSSVLTDAAPTATVLGGNDALYNNIDSPRSLEVVDEIKEALRCPGVVSFADIVAMGARNPVVLVKDMMLDLEKGIKEVMDAPAHQAQDMSDNEEQDLTLELLRVHQVEVGAVAGETNHGQKKWLPYWFLAVASVIILTNHIRAAPVLDQLFPPELAVFAVLLCAVCLILSAMKQMTT